MGRGRGVPGEGPGSARGVPGEWRRGDGPGQEQRMTKFDLTAREFEALPPRSAFAERYRNGAPQVVWTRLVADLETPVSAALKLSDGQPMSCLLESVEGGAVRGRYSIIGLAP